MSANDKQVDGEHYQKAIQPWAYIEANNLDFFEGNVVKYVTRWKEKDGIVDLYKTIHYLEKIIERARRGAYGMELIEVNSAQSDIVCNHCVSPPACEFNDRCQKGFAK